MHIELWATSSDQFLVCSASFTSILRINSGTSSFTSSSSSLGCWTCRQLRRWSCGVCGSQRWSFSTSWCSCAKTDLNMWVLQFSSHVLRGTHFSPKVATVKHWILHLKMKGVKINHNCHLHWIRWVSFFAESFFIVRNSYISRNASHAHQRKVAYLWKCQKRCTGAPLICLWLFCFHSVNVISIYATVNTW